MTPDEERKLMEALARLQKSIDNLIRVIKDGK